jgi:hypothetical protein
MSVEIPLKAKYRRDGKTRHKAKTNNNQTARQHRQLTPAEVELRSSCMPRSPSG